MEQGWLQGGGKGGGGTCVCVFHLGACMLICDEQGLEDVDALVIAENLNNFKRLRRLNLVSWGRGGGGGRAGRYEAVMCVLRHVA